MAGILSWICKRTGFRRDIGPRAEEVKVLTDQFYTTLRAISNKAEESQQKTAPAAWARVNEILTKDRSDWSWSDAYEAEQQLIHLFDEETLKTEVARRVLEARSVLHAPIAEWYREQAAKADNAKDRRALLLRLVNDLQWRYTVNEAKRGYSKQITSRTGRVFIVATSLFVGAILLIYRQPSVWHGMDTLIVLAALAGTWGAMFSILTGLRKRLEEASFDDLKLVRSWSLLFSRVLIGMGAALVLYFFLLSDLLKGDIFPNISNIGSNPGPGLTKDSALLVLWCFLAGFSEKLVPGLLARTESQAPGDRPQLINNESRSAASEFSEQAARGLSVRPAAGSNPN